MPQIQHDDQAGESARQFIEFVMMHAQQAALFLGQFPHPETGERMVNLDAARLFIDQLAMIRSKTKGNLSQEEEGILGEALGSLQIAFVEAVRVAKAEGAALGGDSPEEMAAPELSGEASAAAAGGEIIAPETHGGSEPPEDDGTKRRFTKSYG